MKPEFIMGRETRRDKGFLDDALTGESNEIPIVLDNIFIWERISSWLYQR